MFCLHNRYSFSTIVIEKFLKFNIYINNILSTLITFLFFIFLILITLYIYNNNFKLKKNIIVVVVFLFFNLLIILFLLYIFKFFINFKVVNYKFFVNKFINLSLNTNNLIISDTIVFLCIGTVLISWLFLSERYLLKNIFSVLYFYIFIIFTLNMVYTNNLLTIFIYFEFIFIPSLFFVYILGYSKKVDKTIKYLLVWTLGGSFIVLCSLSFLYWITKSLHYNFIIWYNFSNLELQLLYWGFFIGFGIKIPIWPFHYWLTKVHVEAPTGFSIFLSGYLVKTALYCLLYFLLLFKNTICLYSSLSIIIWGSIDASIRMWSSTDIKRLIAFATIQEMNLILIFIFLLNNMSWKFINLFILVHGILSSLLFFLIDQIQKRFFSRNLNILSGLSQLFFLTTIIWLSLLIFRGFPLFIKFFIEWELLFILWENFKVFGFIVFFIISLFGVIGFSRVWFIILYGQNSINFIYKIDILKKDFYIAVLLISQLFFLNYFIFIF